MGKRHKYFRKNKLVHDGSREYSIPRVTETVNLNSLLLMLLILECISERAAMISLTALCIF